MKAGLCATACALALIAATASDSALGPTTIDQWVAAFKQKRDEVVNHSCPG